ARRTLLAPSRGGGSFQGRAIPTRQTCSRRVCALQELHQRVFRGVRRADIIVHENEFREFGMVHRSLRPNFLLFETGTRGRRAGVKGGPLESGTRPESGTAYLMRIGFASDGIGPAALGRTTPRKARHAEIEAPPKEMHRTALAKEKRAELVKNTIG